MHLIIDILLIIDNFTQLFLTKDFRSFCANRKKANSISRHHENSLSTVSYYTIDVRIFRLNSKLFWTIL